MNTTNPSMKPLSGVRIVDMSRLAPGPYCTMLLADMGAEVIVVGGGRAGAPTSSFSRGKHFIKLDLKCDEGRAALHRLVETADVFVESFRPGVADRLGAGYESLKKLNPKLIYCSLTGFGQSGPMAQEAGHDIGYLALTGVLGALGPIDSPPIAPLNLVADFSAGSLVAALGIVTALFERTRSGRGQHIDAAMIDGCLSLMAMHFPVWGTDTLPSRGRGLLAGEAPYYRCYACADGKHVSVGALEPQFFAALWAVMSEEPTPDHMNLALWPKIESTFKNGFLTRTRDEWMARLKDKDTCVVPVLDPAEVWRNDHIRARFQGSSADSVPAIPRFSRTTLHAGVLDTRDKTTEILSGLGLSPAEIDAACPMAERNRVSSRSWPPTFRNTLPD